MCTARFSDSRGSLPNPPLGMHTPILEADPPVDPPLGWPPCRPTPSPPVNRMTDASENITLPQTSFAGGN